MRSKQLLGCASRFCTLALGLFAIAGSPVRASVVLQTGVGQTFQKADVFVDGIPSFSDTQTHNPPSNPFPYSDTVTASAAHTSSTINTSLTQSLFNYGFVQSTTDQASSANGNIRATFMVTTNTPYTLSGTY